jgi:hypothetical protein
MVARVPKLGRAAALAAALAAILLPAAAPAQSDIFVCVDADGQKTYTNAPTSRACKRLEIQPLVSVPAPRSAQRPPVVLAQPANFPRIDRDTQRTRDGDRRRILEDELKSEREKLFRLRAEFNNGQPERQGDERNFARYQERVARLQEEIERSEASINSLNRELAALRQ